jgi:GLE1-like protein
MDFDSSDDSLALWVEHGARHAERCAALASAVRDARAVALDAVRDAPAISLPHWDSGINQGNRQVNSNPFAPFGSFTRDPELSVLPPIVVAPRQRAKLRAMRKAHRAVIEADEQARAAVALRGFHAEEERKKAQAAALRAKEQAQRRQREQQDAAAAATAVEDARIAAKVAEAARHVATIAAQEHETKRQGAAAADAREREKDAVEAAAADARKKAENAAANELPPHVAMVNRLWAHISTEAQSFRDDPAMKRPRLLLKKRVNLAANQIAASVKSVCIKIGDLVGTMGEASRSGVPTALSFTMREIAERLVAEGAGSVALSRSAAFAVGAVIVGVVAQSPDPEMMRNVVLGAFYAKCIYVIPTFARRHNGETVESFRSRLGYLPDEAADAYIERMCGYVSLYAAILQTVGVLGPRGLVIEMNNPFSLADAWTWLAKIINSKKQRPIMPDVVMAFLDISGFEMSRKWKTAFAPMVLSLVQSCVDNAAKGARPGAKSRIVVYVEDFTRSGNKVIKPPAGKVLPASDAENAA